MREFPSTQPKGFRQCLIQIGKRKEKIKKDARHLQPVQPLYCCSSPKQVNVEPRSSSRKEYLISPPEALELFSGRFPDLVSAPFRHCHEVLGPMGKPGERIEKVSLS